jgi:UDP:flavonoid glycosyltransferase YjiC (YdhE family)
MIEAKQFEGKRIFVCPLEWGMGHATRMVPVIEDFLSRGCIVFAGASGEPMKFLQHSFGDRICYVDFPGKKMHYSHGEKLWWKIFIQLPSFLFSIRQEHLFLQRLAETIQPDLIISDNRYGAWHQSIPSVFVTHQLFIRLPHAFRFLSPVVKGFVHRQIKKFDCCWVPDTENQPGLSGSLSHGNYSGNIRYIGPLSRFSKRTVFLPGPITFEPGTFLLVILSGPEPQRTMLEKLLQPVLTHYKVVWFRGKPDSMEYWQSENHIWFDHAPDEIFAWGLKHCQLVISRSGYSTLMDMAVFGKKAILIPTPGQTEQEYLAENMERQGIAVRLEQKNLSVITMDGGLQKMGALKKYASQ